ncbi:MAG: heparinase II/III family protein [Planctomycetes bacterium]|nr:heparinase II/III family protein [Planctomycetota bacterium]
MRGIWQAAALVLILGCGSIRAAQAVPTTHPRLFGSLAQLQQFRQERAEAYKNLAANARDEKLNDYCWMPAAALVSALENDAKLARAAIARAQTYIQGPIRTGHVTFGHDLALCAIVYDHTHAHWTEAERAAFVAYANKTIEANVNSETGVFHNGYYGYKNWGIGLACYATLHENPRARGFLDALLNDYRTRACPALELAGAGGGWAEGHYVHYWIFEWLVFCEAARACEGLDLYACAPKFFGSRAIASLFEVWPGHAPHELNRPVPMGDGGYGTYGGYSEKILAARRILCAHYRDDPAHAAAAAYNRKIERTCIPEAYSWLDFLWNDPRVPSGDLNAFKRSHFSPGAGWAAARGDWSGDATYLFFRCADRFTAHQHLDAAHFLIYKHAPLAGDGGVYDAFDSSHTSNYYLRSIAHNTILVHDPGERFPDGIRAAGASFNDGGQAYPWCGSPMGHNGNASDAADWKAQGALSDIADFAAFEDRGAYVYMVADATRAYSAKKLELFTRQIVFLRPDTIVICDRVRARSPAFKKTWLLQAMETPKEQDGRLIVANGAGRLTVQTLLPAQTSVKLCSGADLYKVDGQSCPPSKPVDHVPVCRVEISPVQAQAFDVFVHVLTTGSSGAPVPPPATVKDEADGVEVSVAGAAIRFEKSRLGGSVCPAGGARTALAAQAVADGTAAPAGRVAAAPAVAPAAVAAAANEPSAEARALAGTRRAELKAAVLAAVQSGRHEAVFVEVLGKLSKVKLVAANEKELQVSLQGNRFPIAWEGLPPKQMYGIASVYPVDRRALYEYCVGMGLKEEAERELMKTGL